MTRRNMTYVQWAAILSCLCMLESTTGVAGQTTGGAVPNWKGLPGTGG